jgi:hypothetical protein
MKKLKKISPAKPAQGRLNKTLAFTFLQKG